jgi:hypothetical protein
MQDVLRTQNAGYQDASQDLTTLGGDLDKRVALALQGDDTQANTLLTLYQAAFQSEQEAEKKRQFEAQMAEQKRQFDEQQKAAARAAAAARATPSFGGGSSAAGGGSGAQTDPVQQAAYNDVASRMGQSDAAIKSDYNATLKSAGYGNVKDQQKIQIYHKLRPDLFGKGVPAKAVVSNWQQLSF